MPDYNPAVALGLHPPENSLAQTFNTIANLQQSQAHTGLYTLQAAQQQRQLTAQQAYAGEMRASGDSNKALQAYTVNGGDPSGLVHLITATGAQNELARGGGVNAAATREYAGAAEARAKTTEIGVNTNKLGIETQTAELGRSKASDEAALRKANMFLANPDQPQFLADAMDAHMAANPPSSELERAHQLRMKLQLLNAPKEQQMAVARAYGAIEPTPEQKNAVASGFSSPLEYKAASSAQQARIDKTTEYLQGQGNKQYTSAQALLGRMETIDHNIDALGPNWMGSGADTKAGVAKAWNSTLDTLGVTSKFHIDPIKVATWEEFNKEQTRAGMELINSNFGGAKEAASIIQMGRTAVAGVQNSYIGAKYISATIKAAGRQQSDLFEYQMAHKDQLPAEAAIQFHKEHPPKQYAMQGITEVIPQAAKQHLAAHPELASQFDEQFGKGTAQFLLGTK